ncbi:MAG: hypothetical protein ACRDLL_07855 [Solirubrobacterales bacterium]
MEAAGVPPAKPDTNVVFADKVNRPLVVIGCVLAVLALAGVVYARAVGSDTKESTTPANSNTGQTPTKTTTTKNAPSDALLEAALGAGAALILAGTLYSRISAIKLPGGAEIDLTTQEKDQATSEVAKQTPDDATNEQVAKATQKSMDALRQEKGRVGVSELTEDQIQQTVAKVVPDVT